MPEIETIDRVALQGGKSLTLILQKGIKNHQGSGKRFQEEEWQRVLLYWRYGTEYPSSIADYWQAGQGGGE